MRKKIIFLLCFIILILTGCTDVQLRNAYYGTINLHEAQFTSKDIHKLRGEWKIVWNEFVDPNIDFYARDNYTDLVTVPQTWTHKNIGQKYIGSQGYGSLMLDILTPDDVKELAIETTYISSAFKIYANGQLIAQNGVPGQTKDTTTAQWKPVVGSFTPDGDTTRVIIHFSNFNHRRFVIKDFYIGSPQAINNHVSGRIAFDLIAAGGIFIMALYHFMIYHLHRRDKAALYFSLLCLAFSVRSIMVGNRFIYSIFPSLDWEIFMKTAYIAFYCVGLFVILFVSHTFRKFHKSYLDKLIIASTGLSIIITLIYPAEIFDMVLVPFEFVIAIGILYLCYIVINAFKYRESGAFVMMLGTGLLILSAINDMLYEAGYIGTTSLTPFALIALILCQSFTLAERFTFAYNTAEDLLRENAEMNKKLSQHNNLLEDLISQRTHELNDMNEELETSNEELIELVEAINKSEAHFRSLFENIPIGVFRYGSKSGFSMVNPKLATILGFESAHALHKALKNREYKMIDDPVEWAKFKASLSASQSPQIMHEVQMVKKNGRKVMTEITFRTADTMDGETFTEGTINDITKNMELKNRLKKLATTDSLTDLWNRRAFTEKMANLHGPVRLALIDIDDFKSINDTFGHDTGDHVLRETADILRRVCPEDKFIARVGGEEFAIIFDDEDDQNIITCLEKLRSTIEETRIIHLSNRVQFTISIGLSDFDDVHLFKQADRMLYQAKSKGKNQIQVFSESIG